MSTAALPNPNSRMTPQWLQQAVAQNPWRKLDNGNILTPPVRLSFPNLFTAVAQQRNKPDSDKKFEATLLFPAGVDHTIALQEWIGMCKTEFPGHVTPQGQVVGLYAPFRDQAEKCMKFEGYVPGNAFMKVTSNYKPQVVMPGGSGQFIPVTDESNVYAGVWAIVALNLYTFGKNPPQPVKGCRYGIQNVIIIADDNQLGGGGGTDPNQDFAHVNITSMTDFSGIMGGAAGAQPAMNYMPAAQPVGGYTPPQQPMQTFPLPAASVDDELAGLI